MLAFVVADEALEQRQGFCVFRPLLRMDKGEYWLKFEWRVWRTDPALRKLSRENRASWLDLICDMKEARTYFVSGTQQDIANSLGITLPEFDIFVEDLRRTGTGTIIRRKNSVKIVSRRLQREYNLRKYNRLAKQAERCQENVKVKSADRVRVRVRNNIKKTLNIGLAKSEKSALSGETPNPPKKQQTEQLTLEQKQEFTQGMTFLQDTIGKYPDGAGQAKALKWMLLNGVNLEQIKAGLGRQITEYHGRYRASYLSLQKEIFRWIQEGNGLIRPAEVNGHEKTINFNRQREQDKINERAGIEQVRSRVAERDRSLSGSHDADS